VTTVRLPSSFSHMRDDLAGGSAPPPLRVVVMGVAASGKTTVGELLARELDVEYADADDFHSAANVAKMSAGIPLTDEDRGPWLDAIGAWLAERAATGAVVTCSALRRRYRDAIRSSAGDVWFLFCHGTFALISARIAHRSQHFMPGSLLKSQFATLEPPGPDERAVYEDVASPPERIVADFLEQVSGRATGPDR
jgi:gluconokinase